MEKKAIRRIAVFTSGGDAPGMNAALRAVVRTAAFNKLHVYGIERGYQGMIDGHFQRMERHDVANIIQRGGTILRTARSKEFMTAEGRAKAYDHLRAYDIDACIAIGGNGTFTGAKVFNAEYPDIPFIGIPGTIDNDLFGSDFTIGFDTAVNTAIEAVDKIRDTADSHNRLFFVEVMGRHSGYIALYTAIGSGASSVLIPETETNIDDLLSVLRKNKARGKLFSVVIVAEGHGTGAAGISDQVKDQLAIMEPKVTVIGHLQRGGAPTAYDRMLASRLGYAAVNMLLDNKENIAVGIVNGQVTTNTFEDAITKVKIPRNELIKMASILAL